MKQTTSQPSSAKGTAVKRGFYTVLALCLLVVGGFGIATLVDTVSMIRDSHPATGTSTTAAPVAGTTRGAPDTRTTARTAPTTQPTTPTTGATVTPADVEPADLFILPFTNEVIATYSLTPVYSETMADWRIHKGVDFKGSLGEEVKALADGTVERVYEDLLWGDCLTLNHGNGVLSTYCGVASSLKTGDTVTVGQTVGTLTVIPCESRMEPHLHLEISSGGDPLDPVEALGRDVRYTQDEPSDARDSIDE